jgi:hypothetical protein
MPGANGGTLRRGGPGRPKYKEEALAAIREGLPAAIAALKAKAAKGDAKAIELCLHYGIGKPVDKLEMSGPDGGPIVTADAIDLSDHEKRALRDAIHRELERRTAEEPADREAVRA